MNELLRKRAASILGIEADKVSDEQIVAALEDRDARAAQGDLDKALTEARDKLQEHVERGAISTAVFDAAIADIEKADSAGARRALTNQYNTPYSLIDSGQIETEPKGSAKPLEDLPPGEELMSAKIANRIAAYQKDHPEVDALTAHQEVMSKLTDAERKAYEAESQEVSAWQRGE